MGIDNLRIYEGDWIMFMNIKSILIKSRETLRYVTICRKMRKRLENKNFTWLSSNCTGAMITHELKCRFNTPTVNLYITPTDFIRFLSDIKSYENLEFDFLEEGNKLGYPVGKLKDIIVYFVHYNSAEEAAIKWKERFKRIQYDNLFVMMSERDGCTYEDLEKFDSLPFENKIVLTKKNYPDIESAVYIPGFEKEEQLGDVFRMKKLLGLKKYYDIFDFVEWLNKGKNKGSSHNLNIKNFEKED